MPTPRHWVVYRPDALPTKERKSIYIAPFRIKVHRKRSGMDHTVLPANNTMPAFPSWAFTRWYHDNNWGSRHPIAAYYSFIDPERLSWPGWLTYSGWLVHISGHPSATGRVQDSESTPAKDRRYTAGPRNQLKTVSKHWRQCYNLPLVVSKP